jgi:hypothetical protein
LVTGHYDTINLIYKQSEAGRRELDSEATVAAIAPGVTDDGSGTAAVMELLGVKAIDKDGNASLVSAFQTPLYPQKNIETY